MLTMDESARAVGVSERAICRRIEAGSLHFTETADGRVLICLNSLLKWFDKQKGETS